MKSLGSTVGAVCSVLDGLYWYGLLVCDWGTWYRLDIAAGVLSFEAGFCCNSVFKFSAWFTSVT